MANYVLKSKNILILFCLLMYSPQLHAKSVGEFVVEVVLKSKVWTYVYNVEILNDLAKINTSGSVVDVEYSCSFKSKRLKGNAPSGNGFRSESAETEAEARSKADELAGKKCKGKMAAI